MVKVAMISLGCSKNQIDAELMLADLKNQGFHLVGDVSKADAVIINTCGFIQSAKEEAIGEILEMAELKKEGTIRAIIVTGCMAERYRDEILQEIEEVDAVLGIGSNREIAQTITKALEGEKTSSYGPKEALPLCGERVLTTLPYYGYIKIAEGCDNCCAYCAIPAIRGRYRSRPMEEILEEARWLVGEGAKEIILIAQDTTRYGEDLYGEYKLAELLRNVAKIDGILWVRALYCYPDKITDELLDVIASEEKVAKYLDIPIQHCNTELLRSMNRGMGEKELRALIRKIRDKVPGITLRTTVMVGFPGETKAQFSELCSFLTDMKFDRLGCFAFSPEEGTAAARMEGQLEDEVKSHREEIVMTEQAVIMERLNRKKVGHEIGVLVEGFDKYAECYFGRSEADAPEIDGKVFFTSEQSLVMGDFVRVKVTDVMDYDLIGEQVN